MPQQTSATPVPGVTHPAYEDEHPNFWEDTFGRTLHPENSDYVSPDPPAFIKQNVDLSKVKTTVRKPETQDENNSIAEVTSDKPYDMTVFHPDMYGTSVRNHELTHVFQHTRHAAYDKISTGVPSTINDSSAYDYGWVGGLEDARKKGKTVSDFNLEQQGDMVEDYKKIHDYYLDKAKKKTITPEDERLMYRAQKAYHPFVSQLAKMPAKKDQVTTNPLLQLLGYAKSPTIDRTVEPPGLPSYDTPGLGILPADPLMGGKSQPTPVDKPQDLSDSLSPKKKKK